MGNHNIRVDAIGLAAEVVELRNEIARLQNQTNWVCKCGGTDCEGQRENADLRDTLDAVIEADERAVDLWRAAHPGNELVIPDRGQLVGWLLEQNAALRADKERLDWLEGQIRCGFYNHATGRTELSALSCHHVKTIGIRAVIDSKRTEAQP